MKRVVAVFSVLILALCVLSGCKKEEERFNATERAKEMAEYWLTGEVLINYNIDYTSVNFGSVDNDGDIYTVAGKYTVNDQYGDSYTGRFECVYELTGEDELHMIDSYREEPSRD